MSPLELPPQDSADLLQDVFQSVAVAIDRFQYDGPGHSFRGWLRTIRARTNSAIIFVIAIGRLKPLAVATPSKSYLICRRSVSMMATLPRRKSRGFCSGAGCS